MESCASLLSLWIDDGHSHLCWSFSRGLSYFLVTCCIVCSKHSFSSVGSNCRGSHRFLSWLPTLLVPAMGVCMGYLGKTFPFFSNSNIPAPTQTWNRDSWKEFGRDFWARELVSHALHQWLCQMRERPPGKVHMGDTKGEGSFQLTLEVGWFLNAEGP